MYKYAVQNFLRKQVHVSSVHRHYVPSEISTAIRDGTETWSNLHAEFANFWSPEYNQDLSQNFGDTKTELYHNHYFIQ